MRSRPWLNTHTRVNWCFWWVHAVPQSSFPYASIYIIFVVTRWQVLIFIICHLHDTAFTVIVWTEDPPSLLTPLSTAPHNKHTKILQLSAHHQNKTNPSIQVVPIFSYTFAVVVQDELKSTVFYFLFFPAVTSLSKPISQSPKYFLLSGFNVRRL